MNEVAIDHYSTHTYLAGMVDQTQNRGQTLYDVLFANAPVVYTEASQLIWDTLPFENGTPSPAPFNRPCSAPHYRRNEYTRSNAITFPYIDIAAQPCCDILQKRVPGSPYAQQSGIGLANIERFLTDATTNIMSDFRTRLAVMASEIIQTGSFTVSGPDIQTHMVDFDRDDDLTVQLTGAADWRAPSATPIADIEGWIDLMLSKSGQYGADWFVGSDTWTLLRNNEEFKSKFACCPANSTEMGNMMLNPIGRRLTDIQLQGTYKNHRIFLVTGQYRDLDGVMKDFFPKNGFGLFGNFAPIRAFGMIKDMRANFAALEYFLSQKENCKLPEIELQSSPLLIVGNQNAMFFAKVTES